MNIKINSRFDSSSFQDEIIEQLQKHGYIEYIKGQQTPMGYQLPGWVIKLPFDIEIKPR